MGWGGLDRVVPRLRGQHHRKGAKAPGCGAVAAAMVAVPNVLDVEWAERPRSYVLVYTAEHHLAFSRATAAATGTEVVADAWRAHSTPARTSIVSTGRT